MSQDRYCKFVVNDLMPVSSIDNQLMDVWSKLTIVQKESILNVIKSFIEPPSIEQYNKEIDDAVSSVEEGEFFTQEEVEKRIKDRNPLEN